MNWPLKISTTTPSSDLHKEITIFTHLFMTDVPNQSHKLFMTQQKSNYIFIYNKKKNSIQTTKAHAQYLFISTNINLPLVNNYVLVR